MTPTSLEAFAFADREAAALEYGLEVAECIYGRYDVKDIFAPFCATASGEIFLDDSRARHIWPDELIPADQIGNTQPLPLSFKTTLAERMATVALSRRSGAWGTFRNMQHGRCIVTVDGVRAVISGNTTGWLVGIVGAPHRWNTTKT